MTWVYDIAKDTVIWSSPIEEFFGFEEGVRGFSVLQDEAARLRPAGAARGRRLGPRSPRHHRFANGAEAGDALLAPYWPRSGSAHLRPSSTST